MRYKYITHILYISHTHIYTQKCIPWCIQNRLLNIQYYTDKTFHDFIINRASAARSDFTHKTLCMLFYYTINRNADGRKYYMKAAYTHRLSTIRCVVFYIFNINVKVQKRWSLKLTCGLICASSCSTSEMNWRNE